MEFGHSRRALDLGVELLLRRLALGELRASELGVHLWQGEANETHASAYTTYAQVRAGNTPFQTPLLSARTAREDA